MKDKGESDAQFLEAYEALNKAQKEAVDTTEGPVMVVAGPGTGKTQILTLRIANILRQTDVGAEGVLALTFTESGARAMRARLRAIIGSDAYRVTISTFHSFCESLIREYPESFEHIIGARALTDIEHISAIETILEGGSFGLLRPAGNTSFYVPHIQNAIRKMKQENITPDAFKKVIDGQRTQLTNTQQYHEKGAHKGKVRSEYQKLERSIEKNEALLGVYREYIAWCRAERWYDFEDMILESIAALEKNESLLRDLEEQFLYILADEHQDVNGSQNRILELLTSHSESPNLFVVGDEKQAIYRFQGASLENFLYFEEVYSGTSTISLKDNYRSGQPVLDAAHELITAEPSAADELRIPLHSKTKVKSAEVSLRNFAHEAVEADTVIKSVSELVKGGVAPEEIAIIVRTNREVEQFAALLRKSEIPVLPSADSDILYHPITDLVRALIDAAVVDSSEAALFRVLSHGYWDIAPDDLLRVYAAKNFDRSLRTILESEATLKDLKVSEPEKLLHVNMVLREAAKQDNVVSPHRTIESLLQNSGCLDFIMKEHPHEGARVVRRLYDEIESWVENGSVSTLRDVTEMFSKFEEHSIALTAPFIGNQDNAVRVMTAHKSKGLEFEHVFIPHLTDNRWGGKKRPEYFVIPTLKRLDTEAFDRADDERRLLYVAITRAKQNVYLSNSDTNEEGKELMPTRLLEDIPKEYVVEKETEREENDFDPLNALTPLKRTSAIDTETLRSLFIERGLSVTGLNNYLASPWTYFYRNMLRIPEYKTLPLLYGDAVHRTLESLYRGRQESSKTPTASEIGKLLKSALRTLPITDGEYTELHERGLAAVTSYVAESAFVPKSEPKCEFSLRVVLETGDTELPEIPLTGVIDRIDFDESGQALRFIDYKTGKPKTRNVIEGKTKNSDGGYKRQLVFYALLLSLYDDERYNIRDGVLAFVEPDSKGVIHEEQFSVEDTEIEELKTEIVRVAKEITTGAFLKAPCDPDTSDYCDLAKVFER